VKLWLPFVLGVSFVACSDTTPPNSDLEAEDTTPADVSEPDREADADQGEAQDAEVEVSADTEPEADAEPEADVDADVDIDDINCPDDERPVGGLCRKDFDRSCFREDQCRPGEECLWREGEDPERPGTCTHTPGPPVVCPGAPGCETAGTLKVGFAARTLTPQGWELARPGWSDSINEWGFEARFVGDVTDDNTFCDCGRDMACPPTEEFADCRSLGEYTGPDADGTEADGFMQGAWIAGFGNSRNAALCPEDWIRPACEGAHCCDSVFAHDDIWARATAFDSGDIRVVWVVIDTVGYFYSDIMRIRDALPPEWGVDHLLVSSTHTHEAPDTIGQWGPGVFGAPLPTDTGAVREWMEDVHDVVIGTVGDAVGALEPTDVYATQVDTGPIGFAIRDTRDPFVYDDRITAMHFVREGGDRTESADSLGILVNWHSHPESMGSENVFTSSDYPHWLRLYLENGFAEGSEEFPAFEGLGGVAVFASGSVGGLLNPLHRPVIARDGTEYSANNYEKAEALGGRLADVIFKALATTCSDGETVGCTAQISEELSFASQDFIVDITNVQFHAAGMALGIYIREIYNWRATDGNIGDVNLPKLLSNLTQIRLGPVTMQTWPGEPFSELTTGLFPGNTVRNPILGEWMDLNCAEDRRTRLEDDALEERFGCFIDPNNPNPPDLDLFPTTEPLGARYESEYQVIIGLGNDQLGYLVPPYDFKTHPDFGALVEEEGDHYEEVVSVGNVVDQIIDGIDTLTDLLLAD
jgi:hypothetical protein